MAAQTLLFAKSLAGLIEEILEIEPEVTLVPGFDIDEHNPIHVFVIPTAMSTETETRDSVLETMACQILICQYIKDPCYQSADEILKKVSDIHYSLVGSMLPIEGQVPYYVQAVKEYGSSFVGSSSQMDGLFDTEALGDAYVFKCPIIVQAIRRLQIGR